ncbi:MAG: DUF6356 family protein [Acetobacteraceae bacterium]
MRAAQLFTEHPASVGESYGQHFVVACSFGGAMLGAGLACLLHAVFPFLCVRTGSSTIRRLHERMVVNRVTHGGERGAAEFAGLGANVHAPR